MRHEVDLTPKHVDGDDYTYTLNYTPEQRIANELTILRISFGHMVKELASIRRMTERMMDEFHG